MSSSPEAFSSTVPPPKPPPSLLFRSGLSIALIAALAGGGFWLVGFKRAAAAASEAAAAQAPEMAQVVRAAVARTSQHSHSTTAIGTVRALRSVTLRNELPGAVRELHLESGAIVEEGALLVALDVTVEEAELQAAEARVRLSEALLGRVERAAQSQGASEADVDRARAERDVALADVERIRALIDRKRVRAPFRARVGLNDLQVGQYLDAGSVLTMLQGVDEAVHVDFQVAQQVAAALALGAQVDVFLEGTANALPAKIVAIDAQIDPRTRNALLRAKLEGAHAPAPGGSVRVRVPVGAAEQVTVVPVSALRQGPTGEHVFVLANDAQGSLRAASRRVTSGEVMGDEVVVLAGLEPGEQVAASGSFKLFDGLKVVLAADEPAAAAPEQK
jgi:membrane fusion protein (multidrug efflux system)